jgi:hypothetical protein
LAAPGRVARNLIAAMEDNVLALIGCGERRSIASRRSFDFAQDDGGVRMTDGMKEETLRTLLGMIDRC